MRRAPSGYVVGLTAALLFGASAPASKLLLDDLGPQLLAGLLYLGAFLAVAPFVRHGPARREARLQRADVPRLAGLVISGGIVAPVLLMLGLERVSGVTGSLLLNLEGPVTLLLGVVVLREFLGGRSWTGATIVFAGSALLTVQGSGGAVDTIGIVLVVSACVGWAIDNNLTQQLTLRDPFQIVAVKTGIAAAVNISLAVARGEPGASIGVILVALVLGAFAYGFSILLDAYALRALGAAREAAMFATAPFAGALLAIPLLEESWSATDVAAAVLMAVGVALVITDRHEHRHAHEALEHEHRHVHDEHHQHEHPPGVDPTEPHSHPHRHEPLVHSHRHVSDAHHRHSHGHRAGRGD
jgi:drug/metabolite transporter (DMT)-like permease